MTPASGGLSQTLPDELKARFRWRYGGEARLFRAPGRVNLIGEHTDYNEGLVMPVAIDREVVVAAAARPDRRLRVYSEQLDSECDFELDGPETGPAGHWSDYVRGVARVLNRETGPVTGANLYLTSNVPLGSGLSSSAALEVGVALALSALSGWHIDEMAMAMNCQRAEHEYAGTRCGLMDQFAACFGRPGQAVLFDCRSLEFEYLPLPEGVRLVVADTRVRHRLASGQFNARRADCEQAAARLGELLGRPVRSLREIGKPELTRLASRLEERLARRARHVVEENRRVREAAAALRSGELTALGSLMAASHRSLRHDFEVSCPELDALVELANEVKGVIGSRMTGGGFGGCTVSLVRDEVVPAFCARLTAGFECRFGVTPFLHVVSAAGGGGELD